MLKKVYGDTRLLEQTVKRLLMATTSVEFSLGRGTEETHGNIPLTADWTTVNRRATSV